MNVLFTEHFRDYSFVAVALWTDMRAALSLEPHPSLQVYSWPYAPPPEDMDTDAIFSHGKPEALGVTMRQAWQWW